MIKNNHWTVLIKLTFTIGNAEVQWKVTLYKLGIKSPSYKQNNYGA